MKPFILILLCAGLCGGCIKIYMVGGPLTTEMAVYKHQQTLTGSNINFREDVPLEAKLADKMSAEAGLMNAHASSTISGNSVGANNGNNNTGLALTKQSLTASNNTVKVSKP